jgi:gluconokinase
MGVAGCGKSTLAGAIASQTGLPLIEGDEFHSTASIAKMRAGIPLTEADRAPWLDQLSAELMRHGGGAVLACSALKQAYRDRLRAAVPDLKVVFLDIDRNTALERVLARMDHHPFPASLVDSQFSALERPTGERGVLTLRATDGITVLCGEVLEWLVRTLT